MRRNSKAVVNIDYPDNYNPKNIKTKLTPTFKHTEKLFYKKFPHRIFFAYDKKDAYDYDLLSVIESKFKKMHSNKKYRTMASCYYPEGFSFEKRVNKCYHGQIFYFDSQELYDYFLNHNFLKHFIVEAQQPINKKQHDDMLDDIKIRVRKKHFFGKYQYKIVFKSYNSRNDIQRNDMDEAREWLINLLKNSETVDYAWKDKPKLQRCFWSDKKEYYPYYPNERLFLNNEKILMAAKLALSQKIKTIEKSVLISDYEN